MSYYNLPKINFLTNICIDPTTETNKIEPYTSHSLYNYYNDVVLQLYNCKYNADLSLNLLDFFSKDINPYEYIFSKVPGYNFSISKLKSKSKSKFTFNISVSTAKFSCD